MKKKLVLLIVCIFLLLSIFIKNMFIDHDQSEAVSKVETVEKDTSSTQLISRAEAFRLISYLYYSDAELDHIEYSTVFEDVSTSEWYYKYIVFLYEAGFEDQADSVDGKYYMRPTAALNQYECNLLFKKISDSYDIKIQNIYKMSGIDLSQGTTIDTITRAQFLALYESVVSLTQSEGSLVQMEELYFIALNEDGTIVTQNGAYYGAELFYNYTESIEDATSQNLEQYIDKKIQAVVNENRILYVKKVIKEPMILENVYIIHGEKEELTVFVNGCTKTYPIQASLKDTIDGMVGNITCNNGYITKISVKPDIVTDKVITATESYIEFEHYGKVEYDQNFKIYKVYGDIEMEQSNSILVGYENTKFVLTDQKISAALITEQIMATNIRVMIKTSDYKSLFHDAVTLTCKKPFTITYGNKTIDYKANKKVVIDGNSEYLTNGRLTVMAQNEETPIQLLSVDRSQGNPSYRGSIEIRKIDEGLVVINELSLEEYLYAVIPSEMPVTYGTEALKTQAVCARSYAYRQLLSNTYSQYGAHIDDSVSFQVYNNIAETKASIQAVKETYGQIIEYDDRVITAYYFSTSCGYTSSISDVWVGSLEDDYLVGRFQSVMDLDTVKDDSKEQDEVEVMSSNVVVDFSDEDTFREFLENNTYKTIEEKFAWYRWKTKLTYTDITNNVDTYLRARYNANPELILTEVQDDSGITYVSESIKTVGEVTSVEVKERKSNGIVTAVLICGTKANVLVKTEYNIRMLLSPSNSVVVRQDKSEVKSLGLLPSAFFVLDTTEDGINILGGGYGHGVGMSQNGAKSLSDLGYKYDEIIRYYYKGTTLDNIYQ